MSINVGTVTRILFFDSFLKPSPRYSHIMNMVLKHRLNFNLRVFTGLRV